MGLLDNFFKDIIGIEPGSQYLKIIKDGEIVFNDYSQISFDTIKNVSSGLGNSVRQTKDDVTIKPVDFTITDFHAFEMFLRAAIKRGIPSKSFFPKSYRMYFCIPTATSEVEKRAYRDSGEHANAIEVFMIHQSCCAAIGLNILFEKKHFILVDFGFSKIEMTVFADGIPISVGVTRMGTSKIYRLIRNFLRRKYNLTVTDKEIDFMLVDLEQKKDQTRIQSAAVKVSEIIELLDNLFVIVNDEFAETVERVSGDKNVDKVISSGIYFTGGGSKIDFLREKITFGNNIKRTTSRNPLLDNANELKKIMLEPETYKSYLMT